MSPEKALCSSCRVDGPAPEGRDLGTQHRVRSAGRRARSGVPFAVGAPRVSQGRLASLGRRRLRLRPHGPSRSPPGPGAQSLSRQCPPSGRWLCPQGHRLVTHPYVGRKVRTAGLGRVFQGNTLF